MLEGLVERDELDEPAWISRKPHPCFHSHSLRPLETSSKTIRLSRLDGLKRWAPGGSTSNKYKCHEPNKFPNATFPPLFVTNLLHTCPGGYQDPPIYMSCGRSRHFTSSYTIGWRPGWSTSTSISEQQVHLAWHYPCRVANAGAFGRPCRRNPCPSPPMRSRIGCSSC